MDMKIATCGWGAPFKEFCATAAAVGYQGIEANLDAWVGREAELRDILERHNLAISACSAGGSFLDPAKRDDEIAQVEATARRMQAFGIDTLEMHCGARPVGGPSANQLALYAEGLNEVGRRCQALGIRVGVHNHCISFLETESEIDRLYHLLDPNLVGLGFDTAHLALAGCDPVAMFERQIARGFKVNYIHLKDLYQVRKPAGESQRVMDFEELLALATASDVLTWLVIQDIAGRRIVLGGGKLGHDFLGAHRGRMHGVRCCDITEYQFAELGLGTLDFPALVKVLAKSGFDGWAAVELDVAYRPRTECARISREYLRRILGD
jgi:sugar phosphate isomerase/epimerase